MDFSFQNTNLCYRVNDTHTIAMLDGYFTIMNDSGDILDRISISSFAKGPRAGFNKINTKKVPRTTRHLFCIDGFKMKKNQNR